MINIDDLKKLREETGAGIADCKEALSTSMGNLGSAKKWLKQKGFDKAAKKEQREIKAGLVETYSHGGKIGVIVEIGCETDFVARTEDFKNLAHEVALQIASMDPENLEALKKQEYIRENSQTIDDLIKSVVGKLGENIRIVKFARIELGKE